MKEAYGGDEERVAGNGAVFEESLCEAEALLRSVRRSGVRLQALRLVQGVIVVPLPAVAYTIGEALLPVLVTAVVALAAAAVVEFALARPAQRLRDRKRAALAGKVSMLREVFVRVSKKEGWEESRIRRTRRRLSRFSIEERGFW